MKNIITVPYPKELAFTLKMQEKEFINEMRKLTVIKLYEIGKISSSLASKILNLNRVDFLELINKYQVSFFSHKSENELLNDLQNA
jgi:predicted HTH domain antitoxin